MDARSRSEKSRAAAGAWLQGALLGAALVLAMPGGATRAEAQDQGPRDPLSGFATNPDAPIEIESDTLEVEDQKHVATFIGNVVATQGSMKLRADRLKADYTQTGGSDAATGKTQIRDILATGSVHITSRDDQSADGDWARYTVADRKIVMGDKVVLRQGKNVIRGTKLFIDLNSGKSRIVGGAEAGSPKEGASGRVKALFQPPAKEKK
ncbi:MAG: lipopolysaccharide transport periplasmic protein LptA [Parvibaculum sp.]|uniref:lipopolysaccharide transport periplasmic protein LptA n=1 Tax=Parvibaculum sp. TaxID=2024848 RepID=UPI003C71B55C